MANQINGMRLMGMLANGERNLFLHRDEINDLNVFPVPDGDTGTNMYLTIRSGVDSVSADPEQPMSELTSKFASAVTLSARGNSGVILSQFLRGWMKSVSGSEIMTPKAFSDALKCGVKMSYDAVANPVEGTMLTVMREGAEAVESALGSCDDVEDCVQVFLNAASASLDNTPNLLQILKDANVIDSGGAGIVYLFEGMLAYLQGRELKKAGSDEPDDLPGQSRPTDYSSFTKDSTFEYGYCTELLIQLLNGSEPYSSVSFRESLNALGESVVVSESDDKIKIHVHTSRPEDILSFCHRYGEFLHLKIENMSVQHTEIEENAKVSGSKTNGVKKCGPLAVVAVAPDEIMEELFLNMGADAVIRCQGNPSSSDYIDAFKTLDAKDILVFPNHPNSVLAALNAAEMYQDSRVHVIESKSVAHCYSVLPMIDFAETDVESVISSANETIEGMDFASVSRAAKDSCFGSKDIKKGEFIALWGKKLLAVGFELGHVCVDAIRTILMNRPTDVITVFCGKNVSAEALNDAFDTLRSEFIFVEIQTVHTANTLTDLLISFE